MVAPTPAVWALVRNKLITNAMLEFAEATIVNMLSQMRLLKIPGSARDVRTLIAALESTFERFALRVVVWTARSQRVPPVCTKKGCRIKLPGD